MPRKKFEISLSILQALLLGIGGIISLLLAFVIGIMVGEEIDGINIFEREAKSQVVKMRIEPLPSMQPLVQPQGNEEKNPVMNNATSKPLITFHDTLTKPGTKGVEPPVSKVENKAQKEADRDNSRKKLYTVQVGAMKDKALADEMASRLRKNGYSAFIASSESPGKGTWYRVRLGTFSTREDAQKEAVKINRNEKMPATVVEK